ncbi:hypothetical protein J6590_066162 [Homalodisca vitripennis]|nr:hypothetical protein J6590_066162 [Homalodisca vitripennis]
MSQDSRTSLSRVITRTDNMLLKAYLLEVVQLPTNRFSIGIPKVINKPQERPEGVSQGLTVGQLQSYPRASTAGARLFWRTASESGGRQTHVVPRQLLADVNLTDLKPAMVAWPEALA